MSAIILHIPIYWRSQARHSAFFQEKKDSALQEAEPWGEEYVARVKGRDPVGWYPWAYNDVIGWIRLSVHQGLFEFGIYLKDGTKGRRARKNISAEDRSAAKVSSVLNQSSGAIADKLIEQLDLICQQDLLDKFHIPREDVRKWLYFVDWKKIAEAV